ncbi:MAG TPA: hypothetical protein PLR25_28065 [Planctomycetaceae bacterium]|nr:hypothetical protein [Planctomycetaceae bacterium]
MWRLPTFSQMQTIDILPGKSLYGVLFLPGTHQLLVCGNSSRITLWDADTAKEIRQIDMVHEGMIKFMTLSPDRTKLLTAGADGRVSVIRLDDFSTEQTIDARHPDHSGEMIAMVAITSAGLVSVVAGRGAIES